MAVTLYFPDGTTLAGQDAADVLARLGRLQWTPLDVPTMKARLSDRAWAWSTFSLDPLLPDDEFLTALDASGLCVVDHAGTPAKPKAQAAARREARACPVCDHPKGSGLTGYPGRD